MKLIKKSRRNKKTENNIKEHGRADTRLYILFLCTVKLMYKKRSLMIYVFYQIYKIGRVRTPSFRLKKIFFFHNTGKNHAEGLRDI
jgi:hypothetical protein